MPSSTAFEGFTSMVDKLPEYGFLVAIVIAVAAVGFLGTQIASIWMN